jgi:N-acetylated-alpha-linked acidic dipeptidase
MADAGVLPYDYPNYAAEITAYLQTAKKKASEAGLKEIKFDAAIEAARRFSTAASGIQKKLASPTPTSSTQDIPALNATLLKTEHDLLSTEGLPGRPWYRHTIYAPGEFTGYAAVVIPGVNEAIDAKDVRRAQAQMAILAEALNRAATTLEGAK